MSSNALASSTQLSYPSCLTTPSPSSLVSVSSCVFHYFTSTGKFPDVHGQHSSSSVGYLFLTFFISSTQFFGPAIVLMTGGTVKSTATSTHELNLHFLSAYPVQRLVSVAFWLLLQIRIPHNKISNILKLGETLPTYSLVSYSHSLISR